MRSSRRPWSALANRASSIYRQEDLDAAAADLASSRAALTRALLGVGREPAGPRDLPLDPEPALAVPSTRRAGESSSGWLASRLDAPAPPHAPSRDAEEPTATAPAGLGEHSLTAPPRRCRRPRRPLKGFRRRGEDGLEAGGRAVHRGLGLPALHVLGGGSMAVSSSADLLAAVEAAPGRA